MRKEKYECREELLARAWECWAAMGGFRADRDRCKRFTYGDQWCDKVERNGAFISEEADIRSQGRTPLKNNLIRRLVRSVLGVFRSRYSRYMEDRIESADLPPDPATAGRLRACLAGNRMDELYARTMEEFLISGMCVHKKWFGRKGRRTGCWTDYVQPDNFFVDSSGRDFRGWDIQLAGEIHDMTFRELTATFADCEERVAWLRECYDGAEKDSLRQNCRVWEIWERCHPERYHCHDLATGRCWKVDAGKPYSRVQKENRRREEDGIPPIQTRWFMDDEWQWSFLTPEGMVIDSGTSPYRHGGHPYVFKAYPFINGEIHSFVSDILDQQKFTNRLISMYDWILRSSAKGVLLMPEGALPAEADINDIAEEWSRFDGVIVFKARPGAPLPQQVRSNCTDIGITELLNIQMKLMEDISGVNGALQGKLDSRNMSGTLLNQQTQNSMTALQDLLMSFEDFMDQCIDMDLSNIRQFMPETGPKDSGTMINGYASRRAEEQ